MTKRLWASYAMIGVPSAVLGVSAINLATSSPHVWASPLAFAAGTVASGLGFVLNHSAHKKLKEDK